jgi:hypothetical protein
MEKTFEEFHNIPSLVEMMMMAAHLFIFNETL